MALIELLAEFPGMYAWISFSCKDETHISSGEKFAEAIKLVSQSPQVIAAGVNCTAPQYIVSLITIAAGQTNKPIVVYPNKGETWDATSKCWLPDTANHNHFIDDAKKWFKAGATIIGGCCRTTPDDIKQLFHLVV
jgi:homocysteine S-methyltransferase